MRAGGTQHQTPRREEEAIGVRERMDSVAGQGVGCCQAEA